MKFRQLPVWVKTAAILYAALMMWLLFGQRLGYSRVGLSEYISQNVILMPLLTVRRFVGVLMRGEGGYRALHAFVNLVGNVVMFIPMGILAPIFSGEKATFWRCMAKCAAVIVSVELIQLFAMLGTCDIDDFILNMLGSAIGCGIYSLYKMKPKR